MKRHDQVSWTSIISGLSRMGQGKEAIWMFKEMLDSNSKPNCLTYVSVISACKGVEETFDQGTMLHAHVLKLGFNNNSFVVSSLINCYAKCGRPYQAVLLFDEATVRDTILFNSMIAAYSLNLYGEEALKLFIRMRNEDASPSDHTLTNVLNACGSLTLLHQGRQVHSLVTKLCSEKSVFLTSALIDMYSKCGSIGDARFLFDETLEKNDVVWTSMILGYAQSGKGADALELFERFEILDGNKLDHICFTAVLTACNHAGFVDKGIEYFNKMRDYGLVPQLDQFACLIDLYARNGHLRKAKELMEEMPYEPNYVMWSSFLHSCNSYGEVELGREAAYQLFKMEPWNAASYIMLANIYAKAGLWNEVTEVRKLMQQKGVRKSAGWSWVEVDKELHVFSVGDATHPESQKIYEGLEKLNFEMKEAGYIQKQLYEPEGIIYCQL
ncbi:pentatricopeptide repeat-containing protein [Tripterygium wilfordii]|uniref:Pentatricopeptide repeat-containing protein n=2 Tax=Tripterygium wilfordii TaxID=458696 RepID=A0A7J7C6T5_TRIWF|nr:pentatricopeptide repeat-containing protein [Tripterygium wilfordii]